MPESGLRQRIRQAIKKAYPEALVRARPASGASGPGWPDLDILLNGAYVALEVKMPRGRVTDLQALRILDIRRAGGYAWVVRSAQESVRAIDSALVLHTYGAPMASNEGVDFDFDALFGNTQTPDEHNEVVVVAASDQTVDLTDQVPSEELSNQPEPSTDNGRLPTVSEVVAVAEAEKEAEKPSRSRKAKKDDDPGITPYLALLNRRLDHIDERIAVLHSGIEEILTLLKDEEA